MTFSVRLTNFKYQSNKLDFNLQQRLLQISVSHDQKVLIKFHEQASKCKTVVYLMCSLPVFGVIHMISPINQTHRQAAKNFF